MPEPVAATVNWAESPSFFERLAGLAVIVGAGEAFIMTVSMASPDVAALDMGREVS